MADKRTKTIRFYVFPYRFALGKNTHQLKMKDRRQKPEESREVRGQSVVQTVPRTYALGTLSSVPGTTKQDFRRVSLGGGSWVNGGYTP